MIGDRGTFFSGSKTSYSGSTHIIYIYMKRIGRKEGRKEGISYHQIHILHIFTQSYFNPPLK